MPFAALRMLPSSARRLQRLCGWPSRRSCLSDSPSRPCRRLRGPGRVRSARCRHSASDPVEPTDEGDTTPTTPTRVERCPGGELARIASPVAASSWASGRTHSAGPCEPRCDGGAPASEWTRQSSKTAVASLGRWLQPSIRQPHAHHRRRIHEHAHDRHRRAHQCRDPGHRPVHLLKRHSGAALAHMPIRYSVMRFRVSVRCRHRAACFRAPIPTCAARPRLHRLGRQPRSGGAVSLVLPVGSERSQWVAG